MRFSMRTKKYLKHVYELSYEDYVRDPDKFMKKLQHSSAPGLRKSSMEQVTGHYNERYFNRWSDLWNNSGSLVTTVYRR